MKGYIFHFLTIVLGLNFFLTQRSMILRWVSFLILNLEYLGENETKFENILTRWSVAQTSLNDEKNWVSKISLDCPFNTRSQTGKKCKTLSAWNEK